jgi:TPR repeat protein
VKKRLFLFVLMPLFLYASYFSDAMRAYKQGDYQKARELFELAVEEDGAEQAQYFLGLLYLKGLGVKKNLYTAKKYLKKAANIGNARAKCHLAEIYLLQQSPERVKAIKLLKEGDAAGAEECRAVAISHKIPL